MLDEARSQLLHLLIDRLFNFCERGFRMGLSPLRNCLGCLLTLLLPLLAHLLGIHTPSCFLRTVRCLLPVYHLWLRAKK
jgi:hypothetical protein